MNKLYLIITTQHSTVTRVFQTRQLNVLNAAVLHVILLHKSAEYNVLDKFIIIMKTNSL